jgi:hypothetical protein
LIEASIGINESRNADDLTARKNLSAPRCLRREDAFYFRPVYFDVAAHKAMRGGIEIRRIDYDPLSRAAGKVL